MSMDDAALARIERQVQERFDAISEHGGALLFVEVDRASLLEEVRRLQSERDALRELLVSAEGYAIANGAPFPFVRMFAKDSPKCDVILEAGCYPRDASREHPGPFALNPPTGG